MKNCNKMDILYIQTTLSRLKYSYMFILNLIKMVCLEISPPTSFHTVSPSVFGSRYKYGIGKKKIQAEGSTTTDDVFTLRSQYFDPFT